MRPIVDTWKPSRFRVRLSGCPRCRRELVLDNCGTADGEAVDGAAVMFAQSLHLSQCRG